MDRIKKLFKEEPIVALTLTVGAATAAAQLINSVAHMVGSSGYALHAAKRR